MDNNQGFYENSASNPANGKAGSRRLITSDGVLIGCCVLTRKGVFNLFNTDWRIAFKLASDRTQSFFSSRREDEWCGTFETINGKRVIRLTQKCLLDFAVQQR